MNSVGMSFTVLLVFAISLITSTSALSLPKIFSDNMVLQRAPGTAHIWGTATAESKIVTLFIDGAQVSAAAVNATTLHFVLSVAPLNGSLQTHTLTVDDGINRISYQRVLFGDVFLCSGQSNMEFVVSSGDNATAEIQAANGYPYISLYPIAHAENNETDETDTKTRWEDNGGWKIASSTTIGNSNRWTYFSAVCWFYGRDLFNTLNKQIPIGLIESTWGGTPIEPWTSPAAIAKCGPSYTGYSPLYPSAPSILYRAMIAPIKQYTIAGALWYQGESNSNNATNYACRFPAMIEDWRLQFNNPKLAFIFVLLAAYPNNAVTYPQLRDSQLVALSLPYVGVANAIDLGNPYSPLGSIHPTNKQAVGYRILLSMIVNYYQLTYPSDSRFQNIINNGPIPTAIHFINGRVQIYYVHDSLPFNTQLIYFNGTNHCNICCGKLTNNNNNNNNNFGDINNIIGQQAFKLVDNTGKIHNITAHIYNSDTVSRIDLDGLSSDIKPIKLLYNYEQYPQCAVYNQYGLPQIPFSIDIGTTIQLPKIFFNEQKKSEQQILKKNNNNNKPIIKHEQHTIIAAA